MATVGPVYPTTVVNQSVTGEAAEAWVNPSNAGAPHNAAEATITAATYDSPDVSQRLKCTNFDFSAIPAGSTINGITVEVNRRSIIASSGKDFRVQLMDNNGAASGDNKAVPATIWPTTIAIATYGGPTDLWGFSQAAIDGSVGDPDFGVVLSCQANIANADVAVDFIRMTIDYTAPVGGNNFSETPADALAITDSVAVEIGRTVSQADTLGVTDARAVDQGAAFADALGVTDSEAFSVGVVRDDPLGVTDLADAFKIIPVAIADSLAVTDSQALLATLERTVADALGITDSLGVDRGLMLGEALAVTDVAAAVILKVQQIDDALGLADAATLSGAYVRTVADVLGITDLASPELSTGGTGHTVNVNDSLAITDARTFGLSVVLADAVAVADQLVLAQAMAVADQLGIADTATPAVALARTFADSLGVTDSASAQIVLLIQVADALGVTDAQQLARQLAIADLLGVTDVVLVEGTAIVVPPSLLPPLTATRLDGYGRAVRLGATILIALSLQGAVERLDSSQAVPLDSYGDSDPA